MMMKLITMRMLLLLSVLTLVGCSKEVTISNDHYTMVIDRGTGSLRSISRNVGVSRNFLYEPDCAAPLFSIRLLDEADSGRIHKIDAADAANVKVRTTDRTTTIVYDSFKNTDMTVTVSIAQDDSPLTRWRISVDNRTPYSLDYIDFPNVCVPDDLIATGGSGRIFWPGMEGCLVDDMRVRDESPWTPYQPIEYPHMGWRGLYPSSAQMQFMAYYNDNGGIYIGAHDSNCTPKGIEFHRSGEKAIKLEYRIFAAGAGKGLFSPDYDIVIGTFGGDWYDAADIYRSWRESSDMVMPPKIADNKTLPEWYTQSPVVITYPVRGHKDMGDMTPNELFPYMNGIKHIERFSTLFDSRVMALLMHWEGSAPWAPPYVWPPYGGEKGYDDFVDALHAKGNLAGLYASGTGYTLRSNTDTTYNKYAEYQQLGLEKVMKVAPDGTLATNGVCAGVNAQRMGYDMCPANAFVKDVVVDQVAQILKGKTDYLQYFDQNLGGSCYPCYGTSHGHEYGGGVWQNEAMTSIFREIMPLLERNGQKSLIGCEAAAAEPNIPYLLFNDARATINLFMGTPVPAYAYVYHEYVNNFMGNQNAVSVAIDVDKSPLNFLQRLSHAFCAGDMLTVILRGDGSMIWDWGTLWEAPLPDQQQIVAMVKNLNGWRRGAGKEFLVYGRMQKPIRFEGATNIPMISKPGSRNINFPSVMSSNWSVEDGGRAQFFVNYTPRSQMITLGYVPENAVLLCRANDTDVQKINSDGVIEIAPLSAVMVRY